MHREQLHRGAGTAKVKHGSLFSGIGGFDLGFERAGIETIWQVEIDEYCRKVLAKNFPHAQRFSDIRECGAHNLPPVDVLSGGFPCQDISNAGKRAGITGERSGLWSEYARIIRELRPRYVVVENVAALLGRGMERVLGDLAACGYDAEWQSIRASDLGAPHTRERVWLVSYPSSIRLLRRDGVSEGQQHRERRQALRIFDALYSDVAHTNGNGRTASWASEMETAPTNCVIASGESHVANSPIVWKDGLFRNDYGFSTEGSGQGRLQVQPRRGGLLDDGGSRSWLVEPNVGRVAHGIPARVDRLRGLGNAIVPQIAEWIGRRLMEHQ